MAYQAYRYVSQWVAADTARALTLLESLSSCAIEDNELAIDCSETLSRFMQGQPVGSQYILGLAWFLRDFCEDVKEINFEKANIQS